MGWINNVSGSKLTVYAELSRKQLKMITDGEYVIEIPKGVSMTNNNRGLYFYCDNEDISDVLTDALEADSINWQYI